MDIAIVTSRWGQPTETFVRREAEAAHRAGHHVLAISLKRPLPVDGDVAEVVHLTRLAIVAGLATTVLHHPIRTARSLGRAVLRSRPTNLPATVIAWAIGTACAARIKRLDWIQAHFAWVAATAADALASARDLPFSVFAHAHDIFEARLADRYTADKLTRAALVLVESPAIAEEVQDRFGRKPLVQRMGVPLRQVADAPSSSNGRLVLSVGSLVPKKGHDDLIRAVADIDSCELEILGEGVQRKDLEALAASLGCADRVRLPGAVEPGAVRERLGVASVFCLASKPAAGGDRDGVPNVLIEAMAQGVPVVSTRLSGIPDLVTPDRGVLVEPGAVAELRAALRKVLDDRATAMDRAAAALDHVRQCYTTERNWALLEKRISEHLGS